MQETWIRSLGREDSPGEENGNPRQNPCLENPKDRGAWWAAVHGVAESGRTQRLTLSLFTFLQWAHSLGTTNYKMQRVGVQIETLHKVVKT